MGKTTICRERGRNSGVAAGDFVNEYWTSYGQLEVV